MREACTPITPFPICFLPKKMENISGKGIGQQLPLDPLLPSWPRGALTAAGLRGEPLQPQANPQHLPARSVGAFSKGCTNTN